MYTSAYKYLYENVFLEWKFESFQGILWLTSWTKNRILIQYWWIIGSIIIYDESCMHNGYFVSTIQDHPSMIVNMNIDSF